MGWGLNANMVVYVVEKFGVEDRRIVDAQRYNKYHGEILLAWVSTGPRGAILTTLTGMILSGS